MKKEKLTKETASLLGWKPIERDVLPAEVATDLLCSLERITMPMRKVYEDARCSLWCAIKEQKPRELKLARRYAQATLQQLGKWNRRATKRRRGLQIKYILATALPEENPRQQLWKQRLLAGLDLAAAMVDQVIEGTSDGIACRCYDTGGHRKLKTK